MLLNPYEPKWFSKGLNTTTNLLDQYSLIHKGITYMIQTLMSQFP